ncbi:hypothetical protein AVEN_217140-1 [Araneus ventricosus]|uniref:Uncharacterized protein n=1 Tax=Araneus ventricosus TaxID=182803 RepID=A0A4Y2E749_ARAVE|nr:hypothetical protein AVEN_217140-1 [Araneus ventricosus]
MPRKTYLSKLGTIPDWLFGHYVCDLVTSNGPQWNRVSSLEPSNPKPVSTQATGPLCSCIFLAFRTVPPSPPGFFFKLRRFCKVKSMFYSYGPY